MTKKAKKNQKSTNAFMKWISVKDNQVALVFGLPIIGWFIGIFINPEGWLSGSNGLLLVYIGIPIIFFYITVPLIAYLFYLKKYKKNKLFSVILFCATFIYSLFIAISTATADEDEFA